MNAKHLLRCALADLEGIMPEFEPSGDREHPAWKTMDEIRALLGADAETHTPLTAELLACLEDVLDADGDLNVMDFNRYRKALDMAEGKNTEPPDVYCAVKIEHEVDVIVFLSNDECVAFCSHKPEYEPLHTGVYTVSQALESFWKD